MDKEKELKKLKDFKKELIEKPEKVIKDKTDQCDFYLATDLGDDMREHISWYKQKVKNKPDNYINEILLQVEKEITKIEK